MLIANRGNTYKVNDLVVPCSPFLNTLVNTEVGCDMIDGAYVLDLDDAALKEYLSFLNGDDFDMNDEVNEMFDFMGHTNNMEYPLDYWKIKLRDNWIRDHFYKLSLWKDPYYGLKEVPILNKSPIIPVKDVYLAGGVALWMAGITLNYTDIDIFTTHKNTARNYMKSLVHDMCQIDLEDMDEDLLKLNIKVHTTNAILPTLGKVLQLTHRLYTSPTEIVHGFDLDSVGILYDGKKLWATERTMYAIKNMVNWFDPARASPSYVYRLCKYMRRGFRIELPLVELNIDAANKYWDDVSADYDGEPEKGEYIYSKHTVRRLAIPRPIHMLSTYNEIYNNIKLIDRYHTSRNNTLGDQVSILIMAAFYSYYEQSMYEPSDYAKEGTRPIWVTQDPMCQLSSTFNPIPLDGVDKLMEWYRTSPFAK